MNTKQKKPTKMKKIKLVLFSTLVLLATTVVAQKEKEKFEFKREKDISKTYPATGNKLSINNSFGNVKYVTWDKNEIKVDIHIEASANKDDEAQRIFNAINVTDKQQGNEVRFKTSIENDNSNCKNCKSTMSIDYEVHLPANLTLNSENSFGGTEIPDYTGELSVINKFGSLTAGNLGKVRDIQIEFGSADVKSMSDLDATFKFSKIEIGTLSGDNTIKFEFCDGVKLGLDNKLTSLKVDNSYSTVNLRSTNNFAANYTITSHFGDVVDRSNANIKRTDEPDKYGPDSDRKYSGQSGSGGAKINVKSSFGKIIIGEATDSDMEKKEAKSKQKNKQTT
jgi:hypothetical protein